MSPPDAESLLSSESRGQKKVLYVGCRYLRAARQTLFEETPPVTLPEIFAATRLRLQPSRREYYSTFLLTGPLLIWRRFATKLPVCFLKAEPVDGGTFCCVDEDETPVRQKCWSAAHVHVAFCIYISPHFFPRTPMSALTKDFDSPQRKAFGTLHMIRSLCKVGGVQNI